MGKLPLMPKATAVWLVDNTSLTFDQIAEFCGLHPLEVKGIADGDVASGIRGMDPISAGQLTREEIEKGQANPAHRLKLAESKIVIPRSKSRRKPPKYTPLSRRQDRPNAILWLVTWHSELSDNQIMRLVRTTRPTIEAIRKKEHWNAANLKPADPVLLGLCKQTELDAEVKKAAERAERLRAEQGGDETTTGETLRPVSETTQDVKAEDETAPEDALFVEGGADSEPVANESVESGAETDTDSFPTPDH